MRNTRTVKQISEDLWNMTWFFFKHGDSLSDEQMASFMERDAALRAELKETTAYAKSLIA